MNEETTCWDDVSDVLAAGMARVLLYGPPGTGKTFGALHFGAPGGAAERIVCTDDLTSGEITGTWMPRGEQGFEWWDGPAIRAWCANEGQGGRLVVDEVDRASGDALATLLAVTDSVESSRWRHPDTREWLRPGPDFSVVMTSNVDDLEEIPSALRDRFPVRIRVDRPHPAALERLSADLRVPAENGSLGPAERRVSLRAFYAFDQLRDAYGPRRAADLVFGPVADHVLDALSVSAVS